MRKKKIWQSLVSAMLTVAMISTAVMPVRAVENEKENIATVESPWVSKWKQGDATTTGDKYQIYPIPQQVTYPKENQSFEISKEVQTVYGKDVDEATKGDATTTGDKYQIYPIPQQVTYPKENQSFEISKEVQTVYGKDVDEATKKHLQKVLDKYGRTAKAGKADKKESKIILGIYGKGDEADKWFKDKNLDAKHFEKEDAYALYAKDGDIVILGKDSDAVFYGVSTLEMMFSSFAGKKFYPVEILDYASIDARGYIEGFYGGWTHEQRKSLMKFAPEAKMNLYVYASKTDPYHTDKWDQLYPEAQIKQFKELADLQAETKTEFSWSVHLKTVLQGVTKYHTDKWDQLYPEAQIKQFKELADLQAETKTEFSWSVHLKTVLQGVTKADATYTERKEKFCSSWVHIFGT